MKRNLFTSIVEVTGMILIVAGISEFSIPVAVIAAGVALVVIGYFAS